MSLKPSPPLHGMSPSGCGAARHGGHGSRPAGPPPAPHSSCSGNKSPGEPVTDRGRFNNCAASSRNGVLFLFLLHKCVYKYDTA